MFRSETLAKVATACCVPKKAVQSLFVTGFWKITHMDANDTVNI